MDQYKNLENLKAWLDSIMKVKPYDMEAVLDELTTQYGNNGTADYEVAGWETISGNPECYSYDVEIECDEFENTTTTFIF